MRPLHRESRYHLTTMAGMPLGTPGMPGSQQGPYEIYQFTDRQDSPFMTL